MARYTCTGYDDLIRRAIKITDNYFQPTMHRIYFGEESRPVQYLTQIEAFYYFERQNHIIEAIADMLIILNDENLPRLIDYRGQTNLEVIESMPRVCIRTLFTKTNQEFAHRTGIRYQVGAEIRFFIGPLTFIICPDVKIVIEPMSGCGVRYAEVFPLTTQP